MAVFSTTLPTYAIRFGTHDWSVTIQKCLGLLIQSACTNRSRDAAAISLYDDMACLKWQDVLFKVVETGQATSSNDGRSILDRVSFHVRAAFRYTKSKRRNQGENKVVILESLAKPEFNTADPTPLLLVHALRQGGVQGANSAEEAVVTALADPRGVVRSTLPERPVLLAINHYHLDFSRAAGITQQLRTLNDAATLSGVSQRLITHDICRGSSSDNAVLKPSRRVASAAEALGHSRRSTDKGSHRRVCRAREKDPVQRNAHGRTLHV
jgi:hypothetical protein